MHVIDPGFSQKNKLTWNEEFSSKTSIRATLFPLRVSLQHLPYMFVDRFI